MQSIKIGKAVYSALGGDERLSAIVGDRIFPVAVEKDTPYPFIVYRRTNIIPEYTKDLHLNDTVVVEVSCVSPDYSESIDMATITREALEDKRFKGQGIGRIRLDSASEEYADNAFVQTITFSIKTSND